MGIQRCTTRIQIGRTSTSIKSAVQKDMEIDETGKYERRCVNMNANCAKGSGNQLRSHLN